MNQQGIDINHGPTLKEIVLIQQERAKTLKEMAEKSRFFYEDKIDVAAIKSQIATESLPALVKLQAKFTALAEWTDMNIHAAINEVAEECGLKLGKLAQPLRLIVTGGSVSPPIDATVRLIGKEKVLERLKKAVNSVESTAR
jgi:glutamyl-tRNA synthetase